MHRKGGLVETYHESTHVASSPHAVVQATCFLPILRSQVEEAEEVARSNSGEATVIVERTRTKRVEIWNCILLIVSLMIEEETEEERKKEKKPKL